MVLKPHANKYVDWLIITGVTCGMIYAGFSSTEFSGSRPVLVIATIAAIVINILRVIPIKKLTINRSTSILIIFYVYFLLKSIVDTGNFNFIINHTIGPTGGLFVFYLIGITAAGILREIIKARLMSGASYGFNVYYFLFLSFIFFVVGSLYMQNTGKMNVELFILDEQRNDYQKIGDYISMSHVLISYVFFYGLNYAISRYFAVVAIAFYAGISVILLLLSQLYRSNSGAAFVLFVFIYTVIMVNYKPRSFVIKKIFKLITVISILILSLYYVITQIFHIDLLALRIFADQGYSHNSQGSVESRVDLLKYYYYQLEYNPLFGNVIVDRLTTGEGTFAHSLFLSIQTHLGFFGLSLFVVYLYYLFKDNRFKYRDNSLSVFTVDYLYKKGMVVLVLVMSTAWAFFTWPPLWFTIAISYGIGSLSKNVYSGNLISTSKYSEASLRVSAHQKVIT